MKTPDEIWSSLAHLYEEKFMDLILYNDTYDLFCSMLKADANILELGCGPGNITKYLVTKRPDFRILGTDYAPRMVERAAHNVPSAKFQMLDAKKLDTLNQKFDGIMAGFILPYFNESEAKKLIKDCADKLSEVGILYLSFVEGDYGTSHLKKGSTGDELFFHYYSRAQIEAMLLENSLEQIQIDLKEYQRPENIIEYHTVCLIRKKPKN